MVDSHCFCRVAVVVVITVAVVVVIVVGVAAVVVVGMVDASPLLWSTVVKFNMSHSSVIDEKTM
jgi:hypothetical protein